jgi:hypothetical protein
MSRGRRGEVWHRTSLAWWQLCCLSAFLVYGCCDMAFLFPMAHVCSEVLSQEGGRTSAGAAMAEAHCIFESFGDGHVVCCGEGVSDFSYTRPALSTIQSSIVKSRGIGQTVLARGLTRRTGLSVA